jgi:hypothetical protein
VFFAVLAGGFALLRLLFSPCPAAGLPLEKGRAL